jgi:hypothetical protein
MRWEADDQPGDSDRMIQQRPVLIDRPRGRRYGLNDPHGRTQDLSVSVRWWGRHGHLPDVVAHHTSHNDGTAVSQTLP